MTATAKIKLGPEPLLHRDAAIVRSTLGRFTEVGERTSLTEVEFGDYSYVEPNGQIIYSTIGKFCSLAAHVRINPVNHPMQRASQSHFTYRSGDYFPGEQNDAEIFNWRRSMPVTVGHDVWIGHAAIVLAGRTVGTGAVVAAGSVVTKDVAPYTIVAGNPARLIKRRFPEAIADRLQRLAWWDWSHDQLHKALPDFQQVPIEAFLEKYGA